MIGLYVSRGNLLSGSDWLQDNKRRPLPSKRDIAYGLVIFQTAFYEKWAPYFGSSSWMTRILRNADWINAVIVLLSFDFVSASIELSFEITWINLIQSVTHTWSRTIVHVYGPSSAYNTKRGASKSDMPRTEEETKCFYRSAFNLVWHQLNLGFHLQWFWISENNQDV